MIRRSLVALGALLLLTPMTALAEGGTGAFVQGGVALGWANPTSAFGAVSNGVNPGFNIAVGYRFIPAIAVEGGFTFLTAGSISAGGVTVPGVETQAFAGDVSLKVYPFMFGADDASGLLQPYLRAGIGGGSGEVKNSGLPSEGTFLGRFGGGLDVMFTDNLGVFADGSYFVATGDVIAGVGALTFGGIVRF